MLPEKVFNNPVVQTILKGGKIDHKELVEKFAKENLPPELIETIKTFEDMKDNPEAFVRSKMYDEVMTVVEGNPKLKQTYQSFKEAEKFIKNPELIEKRLEESLKQYGDELLKNAEGKIVETVMSDERAQKLKEQLENYRERLNRIQSDSTEKIDKFTENVAAGITRNLQNAMEETVGLKKEITPFVQDFVDGYSFTD
jgi:RNase H-fold protein (predicted Holliday junction resolvase)